MNQAGNHIGIIGAGMAGITCARELTRAGQPVMLLDKSGAPGGRLATRRRGGGLWNHGAPEVGARTPGFNRFLTSRVAEGSARRVRDHADGVSYVGRPDMRALLETAGADLHIQFRFEAERLLPDASGWRVIGRSGEEAGPFSVLLTAIPAPQLRALLHASGLVEPAGLDQVTMLPGWALLVGFSDRRVDLRPAARNPAIDRVVQMAPAAEYPLTNNWVLHANHRWSAGHLELDREDAAAELVEAVCACLAEPGPVREAPAIAAHRWRYALTERALGKGCLWDPETRLGAAGDWCLGNGAEQAFLSGRALAEQVQSDLVLPARPKPHRDA